MVDISKLSSGSRRARAGARKLCIGLLSAGCSYYSEGLFASGGSVVEVSGGGGEGPPDVHHVAGSPGGVDSGGSGSSAGGAAGSGAGSTTELGGAGAGGEAGSEAESDECPNDPEKLEPGACGCGVPEICADLQQSLLHRYSFETPGMLAADSISGVDATIVGTSAAGGEVTFDGTTAAFVDLPNGTISALGDASFEIWLTWAGGGPWQRIFDFGDNDQAEGSQGVGQSYLYLSPREGTSQNSLRASFTIAGIGAETTVRAAAPLTSATLQHVALVVDDTNDQLRLYLNGELSALTGFHGSLSGLNDVNNWVGRSNYKDAPLSGSVEEFRIYGAALTNAQAAASHGFGPDPDFL
jgi:hypothetical protein